MVSSFHFERATLHFEFAAYTDTCETMPLKILTHSGEVLRPMLPASDDVTAFEMEIADMASSIQSGHVVSKLCPEVARDAIWMAELIQRSVLDQRTIEL